ncbi:DUF5989 family protein [Desulfovibrio litoralis]|uniref:DUF5989 family protein n=1 Tax=Desulfovibrio litoralis TaxID=466107 RepID=UPI0009343DED|nr:DUF5989 family protein [Desulfovibrio litoralis]
MIKKQNENFLIRRQWRKNSQELTQQIVMGYGFGFLFLIWGTFKYFLSLESLDILWAIVACIGVLFILCTFIIPSALKPVEHGLRAVGNMVGNKIMTVLLAIIYYLLITPVGLLIQRFKGKDPIYEWNETPSKMNGWVKKTLPQDIENLMKTHGQVKIRKTGFFSVLTFFVKTGKIIFIPVLLILISLGLLLFFLQTSVIAPFIYTLF